MLESPTNDYLSMFFAQENLSPESIVSTFFLAFFRLAPICSIAPFLGTKLPGPVKVGLAIILTIVFLPQLIQSTHGAVSFNLAFIGYGLKELLLGFIIAYLASIPFYIAESSGSLIDFMRGASSLQVQDPTMQTQTSTIGVMFNYVLIVIFFNIGGPFFFFDAVGQSFQIVPVDQMIAKGFFNLAIPFWKIVIGLFTRIMSIAIQLAAPAIVSILMAEMFLGIANRLAPRVQIVFLGMSFKSLLGLGMLWAAWFFILKQMGVQSISWVKQIDDMLQYLNI